MQSTAELPKFLAESLYLVKGENNCFVERWHNVIGIHIIVIIPWYILRIGSEIHVKVTIGL